MIGKTIRRSGLHYKIIEKLGEGGLVRPSWLGQAETGRSQSNLNFRRTK